MDQILASIHVANDQTPWIVAGVAVLVLILGIWLWRRKPKRTVRRVFAVVCWVLTPLLGALAVGAAVNTHFAYFDTMADLFGIPTYPTAQGGTVPKGGVQEPNGVVVDLTISNSSGFGTYPAKAYLPPQYYSNPRQHFPVVYLLHGTPGQITDWVSAGDAATTGLTSAQAGKPVILVFPESNRGVTNDSECVDSPVEGNAYTYLTQDVIQSVDRNLRTLPTAESRGIGGLSEGGFCALNLGLRNPALYQVAMNYSGETSPTYDPGLPVLFGSDWQTKYAQNNPAQYISTLDGSKGPALWFDVGTGDPQILAEMVAFVPKAKARGFTVEYQTRPGGHDFTVWSAALKDSLPWAMTILKEQ